MPDGIDEHEQALVRRAIDDPQALQILYHRYLGRVYGYAAARIADQHDAEDVVSEIFLRVVKHLPQLRNQQHLSFAAWLFTIARSVVSDHYRRNGNEQALLDLDTAAPLVAAEPTPDRLVSQQEDAAHLLALVGGLTDRKREVIMLRYYGGLHNHEIASVLGIGEKTVSAYLSRALNDLYAQYSESTKEDEGIGDEP